MTYRRPPGLSRTLPKNFTFPSAVMDEPRTPEHTSIRLDAPPPPPRHSSCRVRRSRVRSGTDVFAQAEYDFTTFHDHPPSDTPLPSIEFPPTHDWDTVHPYPIAPASNDQFLAPPRDRVALKTPPAQIRADPVDLKPTGSWSLGEHQARGESIERPGSACSHASDSSVSSIETFASRRSVGGSCTSAESDTHDPFFHLEIAPKPIVESYPALQSRQRRAPVVRERWTLDMDNHLWNIYQLYIQDPTITPFKMTPGSIPPLGVTHRVAREAKRTWDKKRSRLNRQSPFTPQPCRSGDSTPTPKVDSAKPVWPKSEASTRRRLKLLCKRKFSIAPHYQRMMQSRSPTPFQDLFSHSSREDGSSGGSAVYATRDLGVSLVSTSVPGPLSQLAMEPSSPQNTDSEWFNRPVAGFEPAVPAVPAVPDSFPKRPSSFDERDMAPRLGSPFDYHTWGPKTSRNRVQRSTPKPRRETIHVTGSRLRSPPRMELFTNVDSTLPPNPPAPVEDQSEQDTQRHLEELYRQGKLNDSGQRRVRIRNRGATTSSVNPKGISQLFSPPSSASRNDENLGPEKPKPVGNQLRNLVGEHIKRLGSPFKIESARRPESSRRFIKHAPSRSEPFAGGVIPQFLAPMQNIQPEAMSSLPYNPLEQGISDAERIRRQILNMSYTRQ